MRRGLLLLSWRDPGTGPDRGSLLRALAADGAARVLVDEPGLMLAVRDGPDLDEAGTIAVRPDVVVALSTPAGVDVDGRPATAGTMLRRSAGTPEVSDVLAPFGVVMARRVRGGWQGLATTDLVGLAHLSWVQADGWAACSTSSLLLAAAAGRRPDGPGLAALALLGHGLDGMTPYEGVRLVPPRQLLVLEAGLARLLPTTGGPDLDGEVAARRTAGPRGRDVVGEGRDAIRRAVAACTAGGSPVLELSGGIDSRMVLAAVGRSDRGRLRAVTLASPDDDDAAVVGQVAAVAGVRHQCLPLRTVGAAPAAVLRQLQDSARTRDYSGNPLAAALLDDAERRLPAGPRLTGQNGELARGFYYALQPGLPSWAPRPVPLLLRARILADGVEPGLWRPGVAEELAAGVAACVRRQLDRYRDDWLTATDRFYLDVRMARWVGLDFSSASADRRIRAPFFHPDFLAWALSAPPRHKRRSRLFAAVLAQLDPALAALPLEHRLPPAVLAATRPADRLAVRLHATTSSARAVAGRASGARRRGACADAPGLLAEQVRRAWREDEGSLRHAAEHPWLDGDAVERVRAGRAPAAAATVAFLLDLDGAMTALGRRLPAAT